MCSISMVICVVRYFFFIFYFVAVTFKMFEFAAVWIFDLKFARVNSVMRVI